MDEERFPRVGEIMSRMAAGDGAAIFTLAAEFGDELAIALRRHLRALGAKGIGRDDLDALVVDVCMELFRIAGTWRPESGVPPWVWARHRLHGHAARFVGQWADDINEDELEIEVPAAAAGAEPAPADVLADLAARVPMCGLLRDALNRVGSVRDQAIVLEVALQQALGDPSPSQTVAALHGMKPAAVRQVWHRVRARLRTLVASDAEFATLDGLAFLA